MKGKLNFDLEPFTEDEPIPKPTQPTARKRGRPRVVSMNGRPML